MQDGGVESTGRKGEVGQGKMQSSAMLCVAVLLEASAECVRDALGPHRYVSLHPGLLAKVCKEKKKKQQPLFEAINIEEERGICLSSFLPFLFLFSQGCIQRELTELHFQIV